MALLMLFGCGREPYAFKKEDRTYVADEEHIDFKLGVAVGQADALDDNTFNAIAWNGVVQYVDRYPKVKVQRCVPLSNEDAEMKRVVDELLTVGCDVIFGFGQEYAKVFKEAVPANKDVTFILFSGGKLDIDGENYVAIDFQDQQSSFLAGVAAALNTDTKKVGFIGGKPDESVTRQSLGFKTGVNYANANYQTGAYLVEPRFADAFDDIGKGRKIAKELYDKKVDVIFACARVTGIGVIEEAKTRLENKEDVWMIGVDNDLYEDAKGIDEKSVVLTSVVKRMDVVIYEILEDFSRKRFPGGKYLLRTLNDNGLGLPKENKNFNEKTKVIVSRTEQLLREGSLVIPFELDELETFSESFG